MHASQKKPSEKRQTKSAQKVADTAVAGDEQANIPIQQANQSARKRTNDRWLLVGIASVLVALLLVVLLWFALDKPTSPSQLIGQPNNPLQQSQPTPIPTPTPEASFSVLLMGRGGAGHDGGALTDTMLVAKILLESKRVVMISIPRDLWVETPYWETANAWGKINSAYAIGVDSDYKKKDRYTGPDGGIKLASDVVSTVTGLSIDKTVVIDFSGFEQAIDQLGGVEINVERAFTDYEYPIRGREKTDCTQPIEKTENTPTSAQEEIEQGKIVADNLPKLVKEFPCRYEPLRFASGKQLMDGKTALKYVRSRHSAEEAGDFSRSRRQRNLLTAVIDRLFSLNQIPKIPSVFSTARNHIDTDLSVTDIASWIPRANELRSFPITSLTLSTDNYVAEGYTADRQFVLKPLPGEGKYEQIYNWIQSTIRTDVALMTPTIEIVTNNRVAGTELQNRLKAAHFPVKLTVTQQQATTSATLIQKHLNVEPETIDLLMKEATVSGEFVQKNEDAKIENDIRLILP